MIDVVGNLELDACISVCKWKGMIGQLARYTGIPAETLENRYQEIGNHQDYVIEVNKRAQEMNRAQIITYNDFVMTWC